MIFRSCNLWRSLAACSLVVLSACAGTTPQEDLRRAKATTAGDFFIGSQPVYARLANEKSGSWVFTDIMTSDVPLESGYLVRLNDLTPAFDIRTAECMPQVYPEQHRCSPSHPFREKDAGVIDKIISGGIAVGTAGKVTDISQAYETRFDETRFNRAVDEALINSGMQDDRRRIIGLIDSYDARFAELQAKLTLEAEQLVESRTDAPDPVLDIQPSIDGLVEFYAGDIDFRELVRIETAGAIDVPGVALEKESILPCKVRDCLSRAETAMAALDSEARAAQTRLAASANPGGNVMRIVCDPTAVAGYLIDVDCPSQLEVSGPGPVLVPIRVSILSRDFEGLYPDFSMADDNLRIEIEGSVVKFLNTSGEYLTLTAQTIYYNSRVNTTSLRIDVPPGIAVSRDIGEFTSRPVDIESTYRNMTPDKAAGAEFEFGFAARYRTASATGEQTLHDVRVFNVGCVVSNRVRPNSCRQEQLADSGAGGTPEAGDRSRLGPM